MNPFIQSLEKIAQLLKANHWQLVTAESCTGGLVASYITDIAGSSVWFERGFVTYSNLAKEQMLGVPKELIAKYGAVSKEVASAMVIGALEHSAGHFALSVTGIAGPDGGSIEKPVGTVCFAWMMRGKDPFIIRKQYKGSRQDIRIASCQEALDGVLALINNNSVN